MTEQQLVQSNNGFVSFASKKFNIAGSKITQYSSAGAILGGRAALSAQSGVLYPTT
jgi:hypothetical protein